VPVLALPIAAAIMRNIKRETAMRTNSLKARLARGETVYGTMIFEWLSPGLPAILDAAGADFVLYDMEHSGFDLPQMKQQFAAARGLGIVPLIRPPAKTYSAIARLLDVGALGLLVPMVESAEEMTTLISWTRYPPDGCRGAIFGGAHDDYGGGSIAEKMGVANERTLVMPLIETVRGLEAVDKIAAVAGVDGLHLGQMDLTISMGIPGQFEHPAFQQDLERLLAACRRHGKFAACMASDLTTLSEWKRRGFRLISCSYDIALLQSQLAAFIAHGKAAG
jgi:2-keto-3-deoxy-L-rhamnonate aldolase RhmA